MGYTIYWKALRQHSTRELEKYNKTFTRVYKSAIAELRRKGLVDFSKYEWCGDKPMTNAGFEFMKTARKNYDYAVKKALLAVQKVSNNGYKITCDDEFEYTKTGINFSGEGLIESYRPIKIVRGLTLDKLPIAYESKGQGKYTTGDYDWNER